MSLESQFLEEILGMSELHLKQITSASVTLLVYDQVTSLDDEVGNLLSSTCLALSLNGIRRID